MVHGIKDSEILEGVLFPVVWGRFLDFVEKLLNNYVVDTDEDDDDDEASQGLLARAVVFNLHNSSRSGDSDVFTIW